MTSFFVQREGVYLVMAENDAGGEGGINGDFWMTSFVNDPIATINRTPSEKVHLSFLKWALGVHKKTSNVGVWGGTGRFPLIYQSILQTLNYYKHLLKAPNYSLVSAALKEQKLLKLPWFKNIEPLLKLDEIFQLGHVSVHRVFKKAIKYKPENVLNNIPARYKPVLDQLQEFQNSQPMSSKFIRT